MAIVGQMLNYFLNYNWIDFFITFHIKYTSKKEKKKNIRSETIKDKLKAYVLHTMVKCTLSSPATVSSFYGIRQ